MLQKKVLKSLAAHTQMGEVSVMMPLRSLKGLVYM
jgi:hypothetical protein